MWSSTKTEGNWKNLPRKLEIVLIVGNNKSSKKKKLYEISKNINEKSYLIQDKTELNSSFFSTRIKLE